MLAFVLDIVLAQATPVAAPSSAPVAAPAAATDLLAGWTAVAPSPQNTGEYKHFTRREPDGTESMLFATRRVCDCQPAPMLAALAGGYAMLSHGQAVEDRSKTAACGQSADEMVVTNIARPENAIRNSDMIIFRDNDALVVLMYTFRSAAAKADARAALATLCPPVLL